jgi:hypothetical protein
MTHRNWLGTPIGFNLIGFAVNSRRWLFARPLLQRRTAWSTLHRRRWRLLPDQHPLQLPEIAVVEKPADHVRRDLLGTDRVKLVSGREL